MECHECPDCGYHFYIGEGDDEMGVCPKCGGSMNGDSLFEEEEEFNAFDEDLDEEDFDEEGDDDEDFDDEEDFEFGKSKFAFVEVEEDDFEDEEFMEEEEEVEEEFEDFGRSFNEESNEEDFR